MDLLRTISETAKDSTSDLRDIIRRLYKLHDETVDTGNTKKQLKRVVQTYLPTERPIALHLLTFTLAAGVVFGLFYAIFEVITMKTVAFGLFYITLFVFGVYSAKQRPLMACDVLNYTLVLLVSQYDLVTLEAHCGYDSNTQGRQYGRKWPVLGPS
jgi:hypothetical protein